MSPPAQLRGGPLQYSAVGAPPLRLGDPSVAARVRVIISPSPRVGRSTSSIALAVAGRQGVGRRPGSWRWSGSSPSASPSAGWLRRWPDRRSVWSPIRIVKFGPPEAVDALVGVADDRTRALAPVVELLGVAAAVTSA